MLDQLSEKQRSRPRLDKTKPATQWFFPGLKPRLSIDGSHLQSKLRRYGVPTRSARQAALAGLASDLPSAVVAELFGLHISTATRWAKLAKRDWGGYLAARANTTTLANNGSGISTLETTERRRTEPGR